MTFDTDTMRGFRFETDCEVFSKSDGSDHERRIGGICTTDDLDRQSEVILQDGLDFGPFLKSGWFNDNHDGATDALVGYPTRAEYRQLGMRKGWYVEGYLLKGSPRADAIWMLANALQKTDRRLGFSVEGAVAARDPQNPSTIRKAIVREVAITRCPVNASTALHVLAKSLSAGAASSVPTAPVTGEGAGRVIARRSVEADAGGSADPLAAKRKRRKKNGALLSEVEERLIEKAERGEPLTRNEASSLLRVLAPNLSQKQADAITDYHFRYRAT